ncbi:MAG: methyltransferase domain-containing protein [Clostridia bacterium]|nr:methyltransferase domain-containing protein [Clostridia bacterium]
MLLCPVCGKPLEKELNTMKCTAGHSYDVAKEGYVNLLRAGRPGDRIGDDAASCRARRDFLNKGYYAPLRDRLKEIFAGKTGKLLDICCGEGYYTSALGTVEGLDVYGFDISREAVRLAAKRGGARYFVANMTSVPVPDGAFDFATHLFAPFCDGEFSRVLKKGGTLITVLPGALHLWGLKRLLYEHPYENSEVLPDAPSFVPVKTESITYDVTVEGAEQINAVFRMTPYFFHTSRGDREKLEGIDRLETTLSFLIAEMEKK